VAAANGALSAVFDATRSVGKSADVAASLAAFAVGGGVYEILFAGAGPDANGGFDADNVARNALLIAGTADPADLLKRMLHDYVSFALFSAGAVLGSNAEATLVKSVRDMLDVIKP
jgi:hypothetical protein